MCTLAIYRVDRKTLRSTEPNMHGDDIDSAAMLDDKRNVKLTYIVTACQLTARPKTLIIAVSLSHVRQGLNKLKHIRA